MSQLRVGQRISRNTGQVRVYKDVEGRGLKHLDGIVMSFA